MILEQGTMTVDNSLTETTHGGEGYNIIMRGNKAITNNSTTEHGRMAKAAIQILELPNITNIAIIGTGYGLLPRLLQGRGYNIDMYEIEGALEQFSEGLGTFIAGDWNDTLDGEYDIIVYDVGDTDYNEAILNSNLADGGILIITSN